MSLQLRDEIPPGSDVKSRTGDRGRHANHDSIICSFILLSGFDRGWGGGGGGKGVIGQKQTMRVNHRVGHAHIWI